MLLGQLINLYPAVNSILSEGNNINIATVKKGTVLPEGTPVWASEHIYSFDYAYKIEGSAIGYLNKQKNRIIWFTWIMKEIKNISVNNHISHKLVQCSQIKTVNSIKLFCLFYLN